MILLIDHKGKLYLVLAIIVFALAQRQGNKVVRLCILEVIRR